MKNKQISKELLIKLYLEDQKTLLQIIDELVISRAKLDYLFKKYNISKRLKNDYISEEILRQLYLIDCYSISDIMSKYDITRPCIKKLLTQYNILEKSISEIQKSEITKYKVKNTCLEKYGNETYLGSTKCKEKTKQTSIIKYGVDHPSKSQEVKDKVKNTCLEKYSKTSYLGTDESIKKRKQIKLLKYSDENYCNKDKIKKTKLLRYGNENYNNSDQNKLTCIERYGVDNPSKLEEVKQKKINTSIENYGTEYPIQNKIFQLKLKNIFITKYGVCNPFLLDTTIIKAHEKMLELYGVKHGFQSIEIQKKCVSNLFKIKTYKFPSGRITYVLGYENIMLDILINETKINENDILTNTDCPIIPWIDNIGKLHNHIPDIFIKSQNKIIEVKGEYTASINLEHILLKKQYAEKLGYIYQILVINKKTKSILYEINPN